MSLFSRFSTPSSSTEDTIKLQSQVKALRAKTSLDDVDHDLTLISQVMEEAGDYADIAVGDRLGKPVTEMIVSLIVKELFYIPLDLDAKALGGEDGVIYRNDLRAAVSVLQNASHSVSQWVSASAALLTGIYQSCPDHLFVDPDSEGHFEEYSRLTPIAPLYTYVKDLPNLLAQFVATIFADDLRRDKVFEKLREELLINIATVSKIPLAERHHPKKAYVLPGECKLEGRDLIFAYLENTPLLPVFLVDVPQYIPDSVRFEHTHIVAGTGHGKTQTLQYLISGDLEQALTQQSSLVVMDGQGDLLNALMASSYFEDERLRKRFIYIDPTDIERPVGLNLFDIDLNAQLALSPQARETILNNTIELYDFFFSALLGAELTQKQGLVFRYLAVLMMRIPGATIHTLRDLMENGEKYKKEMATLGGSARAFFETRFFDRSFNETKKQVLNRLWGVLANQSLDRMMSSPKNTVDLYTALQQGSIIFINTAKDFFGEEGSAIFSRMFVALLGQALLKRAAIKRHERTPSYIYIDEAERVVDITLIRMLAQVRKYKGAITFAHQHLEQLSPECRAGVMTNTSIKLAGGVSAKDASVLAPEFRTDAAFLLEQRKRKRHTEFACFAKNVTERAVSLSIPLGHLESLGTQEASSLTSLIEESRQKYGVVYVEPKELSTTEADNPSDWLSSPQNSGDTVQKPLSNIPGGLPTVEEISENEIVITRLSDVTDVRSPLAPMGGGGAKHKHIEHLIKSLGEERGFRASIEETVHDGAGRVDVVLRRNKIELAFEISVTTTRDHELGNIEKCLALPFTHVVMMASHAKHLKSLSLHIKKALEEDDMKRVSFLLPDDIAGFLDGYREDVAPIEKTVKGYTVKSRMAAVDSSESIARRRAIVQVVARSLST